MIFVPIKARVEKTKIVLKVYTVHSVLGRGHQPVLSSVHPMSSEVYWGLKKAAYVIVNGSRRNSNLYHFKNMNVHLYRVKLQFTFEKS